MEDSTPITTPANNRFVSQRAQPLRATGGELYIGIDIGSTSSDVVVLDDAGKILFSDYKRTRGRPIEVVYSQLKELFQHFNPSNVSISAATGSAGRLFAELTGIPFINEVSAQAEAISNIYPHFSEATIIEMGGQDTKLVFITGQNGKSRVKDFALNTVCAAGTGSFLDQQADRLGINIEDEFGQLALQSKTVPPMAGRCSVFAKSDMIHLQQQATPTCDIIAGLCLALARNLKSNLGCGRKFTKPIIFTGGVAANIGVAKALEKVFELSENELEIAENHFFTGAIGSVFLAKKRFAGEKTTIDLEKIDNYLKKLSGGATDAPRREILAPPSLPEPKSMVHEDLLADATEPIEAYLGVDVGSISTNVVVIDKDKRLLAKAYLMTAGKPLEAVRQGLRMVGEKVAGKVNIAATATTGSGRYLTGDFIGAELVINEITAQAAGAAIVNPKVDTIFEIGGQDSKYISLENGVVVDFEMNHACAAGTGSFLEEQAQRLGINIKNEFAQLALSSGAPIKLGERCTVFMESDLLNYQQQGAQTSDLVAGLSYSIAANYLNRVVGRRKIGNNICFQGGTAFNKAVWAAFEKITGKPILVPDHHEVTGALGAASIAAGAKKCDSKSKFKGFENLANAQYTVKSFTCEHCSNNCEIKEVLLAESEPLYYGSRCDRYNLKKNTKSTCRFNAFEYRQKKLYEYAGIDDPSFKPDKNAPTVGIPMALVNFQLLPLFCRVFKSLGFNVVLSGKTTKKIVRMGAESVTSQPCFPVKVAYGHIEELIHKKVDYIFLPSIVSMIPSHSSNKHNQLCPYVQSIAYQVSAAFADKLGQTKILTAAMRLGEGNKLLQKSFFTLGKTLNVTQRKMQKALAKALAAQKAFENDLKQKGKKILSQIGPDQKLFVLVSRPYNGCDEGLNLRLADKLANLGIEIIPMDMLNLNETALTDEALHNDVYWTYGQKLLRAAEIVKRDKRLFAIYLSNFSCGPDSFLLTFFKEIMTPKPCLQLELDEHSADAGVITRLEAFIESLKNYNGNGTFEPIPINPAAATISKKSKLYIPYMGDCAYAIAACFRGYGHNAEVMPVADESALLRGRQFTTGKECLPCAITAGDMLKVADSDGFDPAQTAFFMPGGRGPCRFGMYNCMHRLILKQAGLANVPILSPNQDGSFYKEFTQMISSAGGGNFMKDTWTATVGVDLLAKLILKLRATAVAASHAQAIYENSLKCWLNAVEKRLSSAQLVELMASFATEFANVKLDRSTLKPKIGIVGEIYVRSHPFANNNIIAKLEKLGAVCDLASLAEWVYYTNFTRMRKARRNGHLRTELKNRTEDYFQHRIEKNLAAPLEARFGSLAEKPIKHVLELARPYVHNSFEGEAILSIGKTIEYFHEGFGGVINVMPFGCMPSTVVASQSMRISADCDQLPILNLSFDGQAEATLPTRLEAFVEQVRQRQQRPLKQSTLQNSKVG